MQTTKIWTWLIAACVLWACTPTEQGADGQPAAAADGSLNPDPDSFLPQDGGASDADLDAPDARGSDRDAGAAQGDATAEAPDAASLSDAGEPADPDAAAPEFDAAVPPPDADIPSPDAALEDPDAALEDPDMAFEEPDAERPEPDAAPVCEPACDGRACGDDGCGGTCGQCAADRHCDAGRCVDRDRSPRILSLNANRRRITLGESLRLDVIVTDPDGIADVIGGTLEDPAGASYGAFVTTGQEGAYSATVSWDEIHELDPITFEGEAGERALQVRFFDQDGNTTTQPFVVTLHCNGQAVCNGVCRDLQSDQNHCGGCFEQCPSLQVQAQCIEGECGLPCPSRNHVLCGDRCASLHTIDDCGACGTRCADGEDGFAACRDQQCVVEQPEGFQRIEHMVVFEDWDQPRNTTQHFRFDVEVLSRLEMSSRRQRGGWGNCHDRGDGWTLLQRLDGQWSTRARGCGDVGADEVDLEPGEWMFELRAGRSDQTFEYWVLRIEQDGTEPLPDPAGGFFAPARSEHALHPVESSPYGAVARATGLSCLTEYDSIRFALVTEEDSGGAESNCDDLGEEQFFEVRGPNARFSATTRNLLARYDFTTAPAVAVAGVMPFEALWDRWHPEPIALGQDTEHRLTGSIATNSREYDRPFLLHLPVPAQVSIRGGVISGELGMTFELFRLENGVASDLFFGHFGEGLTRDLPAGEYVINPTLGWGDDPTEFALYLRVNAERIPEQRVTFFDPPTLLPDMPIDAGQLAGEEQHHHTFELEEDADVTVAVVAQDCSDQAALNIFDIRGDSVAYDATDGPGRCPLIETELPGGRYTVRVRSRWGQPVPAYQLSLTVAED